jgi:hypothetical protein
VNDKKVRRQAWKKREDGVADVGEAIDKIILFTDLGRNEGENGKGRDHNNLVDDLHELFFQFLQESHHDTAFGSLPSLEKEATQSHAKHNGKDDLSFLRCERLCDVGGD